MKFLFGCFSSLILSFNLGGCVSSPVQDSNNPPPLTSENQNSTLPIGCEVDPSESKRAKETIYICPVGPGTSSYVTADGKPYGIP